MNSKEKSDFEEWAKPRGYNLMKNAHGYIFQSTQRAFESWIGSQPEIDDLKAEIERLRKDADRLQWLIENCVSAYRPVSANELSLDRFSIDEAMKEEK